MDTVIEEAARCAHEANKAYCELIGDNSQTSWEDAPEWQKQSAINGVKHIIANPYARPEDSHNSWLKEKQDTDWKYGPVKDLEKKEHPCFVPYGELPREQQMKDFVFNCVVRSFLRLG